MNMGDTITEIENAVTTLQSVAPALSGIVSMLVPGSGPAMTLAVPLLSIVNEALAAIETFKTGGMAHESAAAIVGHAMVAIGNTLVNAVPPPTADAAAPVASSMK
jgi:hypothetical protein